DGTKFHEILARYQEMNQLVAYIRVKLRGENLKTFETILTDLYLEKVKLDKGLYVSFMALLYYISELFGTITEKYYRPHNNYGALLKMLSFSGNKAVFVNFNYDLLLEKSLGKSEITTVDELISGELPVIKIHGGYNWYWRRIVNAWGDEKKNSYQLSLNFAEGLFQSNQDKSKWELVLPKSKTPWRMPAYGRDFMSAYSYHPSLALPITGKNNYVCPEQHILYLKQLLGSIDRIIIIGWKLGDPFLKDLIVEELNKRNVSIAFVGHSKAQNIVNELDEKLKTNIKLIDDKGFSNFLSSDEGERFIYDEKV
ncbi:hypothetical protein KKF69_08510, partial [Patescibacteria group bacterium]|nr:hypothetical protein [Patescibacteria group bacterium]